MERGYNFFLLHKEYKFNFPKKVLIIFEYSEGLINGVWDVSKCHGFNGLLSSTSFWGENM